MAKAYFFLERERGVYCNKKVIGYIYTQEQQIKYHIIFNLHNIGI